MTTSVPPTPDPPTPASGSQAAPRPEPLLGSVPVQPVSVAAVIAAVSGLAWFGPDPVSKAIAEVAALGAGAAAPSWGAWEGWSALLAHVLVHASIPHLVLNFAALIAFGAPVARRLGGDALGWAGFAGVFVLSALGGAAAELAVAGAEPRFIVGASTAVSGLMAAGLAMRGPGGARAPLWDKGYLAALAPWAGFNVVLGLTGGVLPGFGAIAWVGHLGGLVAGTLSFAAIDTIVARARRPRLGQNI